MYVASVCQAFTESVSLKAFKSLFSGIHCKFQPLPKDFLLSWTVIPRDVRDMLTQSAKWPWHVSFWNVLQEDDDYHSRVFIKDLGLCKIHLKCTPATFNEASRHHKDDFLTLRHFLRNVVQDGHTRREVSFINAQSELYVVCFFQIHNKLLFIW